MRYNSTILKSPVKPPVCADVEQLAPRMRHAVDAMLAEARRTSIDVVLHTQLTYRITLDPVVYETTRSEELQRYYYMSGVSHASTAQHSWHYYGLAVDIISSRYLWFDRAHTEPAFGVHGPLVCQQYFHALARIAEQYGLAWGGDFITFSDGSTDYPHFQWGACAHSPHQAPSIYAREGMEGVWKAVGAD